MSVFTRTSTLIAANINELLERLERPETLFRHGLREMEATVERVTAAVARSIAGERLLAQQQAAHHEQAGLWQDRAAAAVAAGDDVRARQALALKREHAGGALALAGPLEAARATNAMLRQQIVALRERLAHGHRQLVTLTAQQAVATAVSLANAGSQRLALASGDLDRFGQLACQIDRAEAEAAALAELHGASGDPLARVLEREAHDAAIEAELVVLRGG